MGLNMNFSNSLAKIYERSNACELRGIYEALSLTKFSPLLNSRFF